MPSPTHQERAHSQRRNSSHDQNEKEKREDASSVPQNEEYQKKWESSVTAAVEIESAAQAQEEHTEPLTPEAAATGDFLASPETLQKTLELARETARDAGVPEDELDQLVADQREKWLAEYKSPQRALEILEKLSDDPTKATIEQLFPDEIGKHMHFPEFLDQAAAFHEKLAARKNPYLQERLKIVFMQKMTQEIRYFFEDQERNWVEQQSVKKLPELLLYDFAHLAYGYTGIKYQETVKALGETVPSFMEKIAAGREETIQRIREKAEEYQQQYVKLQEAAAADKAFAQDFTRVETDIRTLLGGLQSVEFFKEENAELNKTLAKLQEFGEKTDRR